MFPFEPFGVESIILTRLHQVFWWALWSVDNASQMAEAVFCFLLGPKPFVAGIEVNQKTVSAAVIAPEQRIRRGLRQRQHAEVLVQRIVDSLGILGKGCFGLHNTFRNNIVDQPLSDVTRE